MHRFWLIAFCHFFIAGYSAAAAGDPQKVCIDTINADHRYVLKPVAMQERGAVAQNIANSEAGKKASTAERMMMLYRQILSVAAQNRDYSARMTAELNQQHNETLTIVDKVLSYLTGEGGKKQPEDGASFHTMITTVRLKRLLYTLWSNCRQVPDLAPYLPKVDPTVAFDQTLKEVVVPAGHVHSVNDRLEDTPTARATGPNTTQPISGRASGFSKSEEQSKR